MQNINLVFVPLCELLVGEWTPDLTTIKSNDLYLWFWQLDLFCNTILLVLLRFTVRAQGLTESVQNIQVLLQICCRSISVVLSLCLSVSHFLLLSLSFVHSDQNTMDRMKQDALQTQPACNTVLLQISDLCTDTGHVTCKVQPQTRISVSFLKVPPEHNNPTIQQYNKKGVIK